LTRPWMVHKKYVHDPNPHPKWEEINCTEATMLVGIGKEMYALSGNGLLMPALKDQPPPDLRYFKQTPK
jgi:alpha-D-ribose 1-methylphosphonate 5-phosphate C-P lyase